MSNGYEIWFLKLRVQKKKVTGFEDGVLRKIFWREWAEEEDG